MPNRACPNPCRGPASAMNVTPREVKAMQDRGEKFRLIDVRELDEWNTVKIEGAELLPLSEFQQKAGTILDDQDEKIVLYCHHGMRSARAQGYLKSQGYADVLNLAGGIDAWAREVEPGMARY